MENFNGICALVSGGASEIGSEVIRALAERGASVLAVDSTEERIAAAIAGLGLADPDAILTSELDGADLFSWYDLGNLVGSYFHTLHLFVHVAEPSPPESARKLNVDAVRSAQSTSSESFLTAIRMLEKYLIAAAEESGVGACAVAVTQTSPASGDVPNSLTHAMSAALADALTREYSDEAKNIRIHAVRPADGDAARAAAAVIELMDRQRG